MFIIFGMTGLKSKVKNEPAIIASCPNCSGDLHLKKHTRWFTLFFIPIFPINSLESFYECNNCNSAYAQKIKSILTEATESREYDLQKAQLLYANALIAAMTHMAIIDNDFAPEEEREINDTISKYPQFEKELIGTMNLVKENGNNDNYVFNLLNQVRNELSSEAILNLVAQAAVVLLADGKIEKEEETLMKEYLIACGIPKDFYKTLLAKLKKIEIQE